MKLLDSFSPRGNCTKKYPQTCRIHGAAYREKRDFEKEVQRKQKELEFKSFTEPDFAASWKIKEEKDGKTTASVYRSGIASPPSERGVEAGHYNRADSHKPVDHQGRVTAIFASPTLGGVCRWVRGNDFVNIPDIKVRELRVDIDNTYVYSIDAWEKASSMDTPEVYKEFWATGVTLRNYMKLARKSPLEYDPRNWELLLSETDLKSVKPVGANRVSEREYTNSESDKERLKKLLR